ncbi:MAG: transglutaminase domain-containing protein [Candidatus Brocadiia bacterium]
MIGTLQRDPMDADSRKSVVAICDRFKRLVSRRDGRKGEELRAEVKLGEKERPLPVGRYRLNLWVYDGPDGDGYRLVADEPLFVIFNPYREAGEDITASHLRLWLDEKSKIVQLIDGDVTARLRSLDIHNPYVFALAIRFADGAKTTEEAARRLVKAACSQIDGYWPMLGDIAGRVPPDTPPEDAEWVAGQFSSVAERIESEDKRGQCFDYTMVYMALLRSMGIPARPVTAIGPGPMPHPYAPERQVEWHYHVWTEVLLDGEWLAVDVTYLEEPVRRRLPTGERPLLRQADEPWFVRTAGCARQVWTADRNSKRALDLRYSRASRPAADRLGREGAKVPYLFLQSEEGISAFYTIP